MSLDVFDELQTFCDDNNYIDVADKLPIFICSVGAHLFNALNKCHYCPFDPDSDANLAALADTSVPDPFLIHNCPLRHSGDPIYTPMSHLADTRLHILIRGMKGSGKNVLIDLFLKEGTGLLWNAHSFSGLGYRTDIGPNSITEAGMFGSVNDEGEIVGRPLAREMCGGFLGIEEFSSLTDASKKEHSKDMKNQLLGSTDSGRVKKAMRSGWVEYMTRYTIWGGTQPGRFELESGLDRRFFIIDIEMTAEKEQAYKRAQSLASNMGIEHRIKQAEKVQMLRGWFIRRQENAVLNPPRQLKFDDSLSEWLMQEGVRSFESDLFRRVAIGYWMMQENYSPDPDLHITIDDRLKVILDDSLKMRRVVMDSDVQLIKSTFWDSEIYRSDLLKEVARMITNGDYQSAKRWVEENLVNQVWYAEYKESKEGRGRRGIMARIGPTLEKKEKLQWS